MLNKGEKRGCIGGREGRRKTQYDDRDSAQQGLEWMVDNLGAVRDLLRVYECRYSADPLRPHFHVGHKPGEVANYGRMPEGKNNHRR